MIGDNSYLYEDILNQSKNTEKSDQANEYRKKIANMLSTEDKIDIIFDVILGKISDDAVIEMYEKITNILTTPEKRICPSCHGVMNYDPYFDKEICSKCGRMERINK